MYSNKEIGAGGRGGGKLEAIKICQWQILSKTEISLVEL